MECKPASLAAALALITPFIPASLTGVDGWQKVGVCVAASLLYGLVRYFDLKAPVSDAQLVDLQAEVSALREKVSLVTMKLGLARK